MSESDETTNPTGSAAGTSGASGKVDAAKQEVLDVKDTAAEQAKDVLGTAKDEASTVVQEAKSQAKDLFAQTQQELKDQANTQQQRIAGSLASVGEELGAMAAGPGGGGVAGDLVQQVSQRLSGAATWLGDRDPHAVLTEVKRFARRRPGTFILAAAVAGIVVGRLTRALAADASDKADAQAPALTPAPAPALVSPDPAVAVPVSATGVGSTHPADVEAPIYPGAASARPGALQEDGDDRPHTV